MATGHGFMDTEVESWPQGMDSWSQRWSHGHRVWIRVPAPPRLASTPAHPVAHMQAGGRGENPEMVPHSGPRRRCEGMMMIMSSQTYNSRIGVYLRHKLRRDSH
jgi:hypothetical protein